MSYRGLYKGMKVYDYLDDIPKQILTSGEDIILLSPGEDMTSPGSGVVLKEESAGAVITFSAVALFLMKIILIVVVGTIVILTLQQVAVIIRGREGKKIDDNLFEGGDGSIWRRDPDTGEWDMITGPRNDYILWGVIAIFLIGVIVLVFLNRERLFGSGGGSDGGSNNPGPKKKSNPGNPGPKKKKKNNPGPGKGSVTKYRVKGYLPGGKGELLFDTREEAEAWVRNTGEKIPIKKVKGHYKKESISSGFLTSQENKIFVEA